MASIDMRADRPRLRGSVWAVWALEGPLAGVNSEVPPEVAEVHRLVITAGEVADRRCLACVLPRVALHRACISAGVGARSTAVRPLLGVAAPHVSLKVTFAT